MSSTTLYGRARERADLTAFVESAATRPMSMVLLGEAGIGKTALLRAAAGIARERGFRVLPLDRGLLRELATPRLDPALRSWARGEPTDEAALLTAILTGLDRLTENAPALLILDRADRAEQALLRLLTLVTRHACTERAALLLAARGSEPPAGLGAEIPRFRVGPLTDRAAARLLNTRPERAAGMPRRLVLRRAGGNPLALTSDVPPREFQEKLAGLPATTLRLLRFAALADEAEPISSVNRAAGGDDGLRDWEPAEQAGLVTLTGGRVRFEHPLIRVAAATGPARAAHGSLAGHTDEPYARALHAALASGETDEVVAAALEESAAAVGRRADFLAEGRALRMAAEHSPRPADAARRLAKAAVAAYRAGEPAYAIELHRRVVALTDDPDVLGVACVGAGLALVHQARFAEAYETARGAVEGRPADGQVAMSNVAVAANAAVLSGDAEHRAGLPALLDLVVDGTGGVLGEAIMPGAANPATRASVLAVADSAGGRGESSGHGGPGEPAGGPGELSGGPGELAGGPGELAGGPGGLAGGPGEPAGGPGELAGGPGELGRVGRSGGLAVGAEPLNGLAEIARLLATSTVAWLTDDSVRAAAELSALWQAQKAYGAPGALAGRIPMMILAMIDCGRWQDADEAIEESATLAEVGNLTLLLRSLPGLRGILAAVRQDGGTPPALPARPAGDPFSESLRRRAAGLAALSAGDYDAAYTQFRSMFDAAGEPVHFLLGPRSLPQLAVAAGGSSRRARAKAQARQIFNGCRARAGASPSPRMAMLLAHAAALLDDTEGAEEQFRAALADPDRALHWPLERAEAQVNFGIWLRRQRRVPEARPHLLAALDTFTRLGARAHAEQARKYLPGNADADRSGTADAFAALTAQKQMIARLAADGMTNREIAQRLVLSPRTVGSHLYDIYPQLGVGNRHQLRELLGSTSTEG
ncbi:helix-turn-helix transcriptional regulator [Paractinoplanes atraurantiacus]|uniref:helix-turn-helix transcriptional regulator n=1 Tax=Paractinoplanes atraurantiacus TaxID=1036182 RepID=UPI0015CF2BD6|nr:AAA family ATPase [Actinoplanes atraurantiacus]